jgi:hypothetical protein
MKMVIWVTCIMLYMSDQTDPAAISAMSAVMAGCSPMAGKSSNDICG